MSLRFLLDTNVISEPIKSKRDTRVMEKLKTHEWECAIASVAWNELLYGCRRLPKSNQKSILEKYLKSIGLPVFPYDAFAAEWHATERVRLEGLGRTPPFADGQIAATAYAHNLVLVTFNVADFSAFNDIKVVDWRT